MRSGDMETLEIWIGWSFDFDFE